MNAFPWINRSCYIISSTALRTNLPQYQRGFLEIRDVPLNKSEFTGRFYLDSRDLILTQQTDMLYVQQKQEADCLPQMFLFSPVMEKANVFKIQSLRTGQYITVQEELQEKDHAFVVMKSDTHKEDQEWCITNPNILEPEEFSITSCLSKKILYLEDFGDGSYITQRSPLEGENKEMTTQTQEWKFIPLVPVFQVCSDLHLEFHHKVTLKHFVKHSARHLIIAGDLGSPHRNFQTYLSFLQQASKKFEKVFIISGNHSCYNSTLEGTKRTIEMIVANFSNVYFLNNSCYEFENDPVVLIGTTLWSKVLDEEKHKVVSSLNDYNMIYQDNLDENQKLTHITTKDSNNEFEKNKNWLTAEIEKYRLLNKRIIIITHHLPSYQFIAPRYENSGVNSAFASNLEHLFAPPISHWIFGHTHHHVETTINGVKFICNPRGYEGESGVGYKSDLVFS
jgi:predicted phosphodiesterase